MVAGPYRCYHPLPTEISAESPRRRCLGKGSGLGRHSNQLSKKYFFLSVPDRVIIWQAVKVCLAFRSYSVEGRAETIASTPKSAKSTQS
jgi:hypothetical protein